MNSMEDRQLDRAAQYGITAVGIVDASLDEVAKLRSTLGPQVGERFPPSVLKPADAQTIVGLSAVLQAINDANLVSTPMTDWGIIFASKFMARVESADALYKYEIGGAWKVNPMALPNLCLHACSGTISQLLQMKGPNFGVGGGTNFITDGLLTTCTLLDEQQLPGLWLVLSQYDPEPVPDAQGKNPLPTITQAVALAFQRVPANWQGLRLQFSRTDAAEPAPWCEEESRAQYASLVDFLQGTDEGTQGVWTCDLDWGGQFSLSEMDLPAVCRDRAETYSVL